MKNKTRLILTAAVLIAAGLYFMKSRSPSVSENTPSEVASPAALPTLALLSASVPTGPENASLPASDLPHASISPTPSKLPRLKTVREEVAKNPHSTPESLTRFAEQMAPKISKAQQNEATAKALVKELTDCATQEAALAPASLRAYCAINASDLSERWPSLVPHTQSMLDSLSPDAKRLYRLKQRIAR